MAMEVDRFLRVSTKVGDITVRALSDLDVRERDRVAMEVSREEADVLRDESSEQYKELIAPLGEMTKEEMRAALVALQSRQFGREVDAELPFDHIPFPDDATLKERHEVLRQREEHEEKVRRERLKVVANRIAKYENKIQSWEAGVLRNTLLERAAMSYALAKYAEIYQYMTLVLSCFEANGKRQFRSWKDVPKTSSKALERLFEAYRKVDSVDPWTLEKNSLTGPIQGLSEPESSQT